MANPRDYIASAGDEVPDLRTELQRVSAEFANYRRRVARDERLTAARAEAALLTPLLPILDDIDRARAHDELTGGFRAVAERLELELTNRGLVRFGAAGEAFDPTRHTALAKLELAGVDEPTCLDVVAPGYRWGETMLRPAHVAVAVAPAAAARETDEGADEAADEAATSGASDAGSSVEARSGEPADETVGDPAAVS